VQDRALVGTVDGIENRDLGPIGPHYVAAVAGLAAALRVEQGPVEDETGFVRRDDAGVGLAQIGVVAEEEFGGHGGLSGSEVGSATLARRRAVVEVW
jgi:hypothetical protein